jgi:hypothetical protein
VQGETGASAVVLVFCPHRCCSTRATLTGHHDPQHNSATETLRRESGRQEVRRTRDERRAGMRTGSMGKRQTSEHARCKAPTLSPSARALSSSISRRIVHGHPSEFLLSAVSFAVAHSKLAESLRWPGGKVPRRAHFNPARRWGARHASSKQGAGARTKGENIRSMCLL